MKENPLIPMMAITGKPSKGFIKETLEAYIETGINQVLIYPRTGCELEYLSDEWFAVCKTIIEEAERLNFDSIWLYDEFNWPSGTCNKLVPGVNPDYAMKQLCVYQENGKHEFVVRSNPMMTDLMNPEAVDCFIAMTHEQYAKHFGKYMGTLIKGFFTDEPDIAFFSYDNKEDILRLPYYDGIEEDYKKQTGTDLLDDIRSGLENKSDFYMHTCNKLCGEKFRTNFAEKISSWCAERNMVLTGHLMNEYSSAAALRCNGHPLHVLSAFSLPGMDEIFTHDKIGTIEWLTLGTVMNAVDQRGNNGGLAELFALGPCDLTPTQIRRQLWLVAMFGINKYVMAVGQFDHRGNAEKKFYFNPFTRTQPWFQAYGLLGEEANLASRYATLDRDIQVEVRYPYSPAHLTEVLKYLTAKQYAWKLIGPEDNATCDVVICPESGGIREECSDQFFFDMHKLDHDLLQNMSLRTVELTDCTGTLVTDVFVRSFQDGTCVVIDFSGTSRNLQLTRKGIKSGFSLAAEGIMVFPGWKVELDSPNTVRVDFIDGKFNFRISESCSNIQFSVRNYGEKPKVLLDGNPIESENSCNTLPQGFREIYQNSSSMKLESGDHIIELENDVEDFAYLPVVWITGEFACTQDAIISPYRYDGMGLYGYSGTINQRAKITIPVNAHKISIDPQGLTSELKINGTSVGKRLWEPFEWIIPEEYRETEVDIEIKRYTSCGRIFGKEAFEVKDTDECVHPWLNKYKPDNHTEIKPFCELIFS